jgi:polysaccharide biosynthesis transport protein
VLGTVPEDRIARHTPVPLVSGRVGYARTEAFHRIRTALESRLAGGKEGVGRVLVVTSAVPGDGRTTTACNLAAALAAVGSRVVLVDGDLRRPRVAAYLGLESEPGLTAVLPGEASFATAVQTWSEDDLAVLTSGALALRPNELLASRPTNDLIVWMRLKYDYVIIDAPPILAVADAANLGAHADGVVLVTRWGFTKRPELQSAVSFLRSVSVPVVGAILSRIPDRERSGPSRYGEYVPVETAEPVVDLPEAHPTAPEVAETAKSTDAHEVPDGEQSTKTVNGSSPAVDGAETSGPKERQETK